MLDDGKGYFHGGSLRGNWGFGQDLPAVIVGEAFDLKGGVLDEMDVLGRGAGIFHDVKPIAVFELLGVGELRLGQGYTALAPDGADSLYFDIPLDFAGGVAGFHVVAFVEVIHLRRAAAGLLLKCEYGINAFTADFLAAVNFGGPSAIGSIARPAVSIGGDIDEGEVLSILRVARVVASWQSSTYAARRAREPPEIQASAVGRVPSRGVRECERSRLEPESGLTGRVEELLPESGRGSSTHKGEAIKQITSGTCRLAGCCRSRAPRQITLQH
jgi:hypothetical protein